MSDIFDLQPADGPVLVAMPHVGTMLPPAMAARMTATGRAIPDTDWHIDEPYRHAHGLGCGVLKARFSRYVVDLNRGPQEGALYPGKPDTGIVPLLSFDGAPLYLDGREPDADEMNERIELYWKPYHAALGAELQRLRERWGFAILWDAHSIRSHVPRLFEGQLPDLNFGTHDGAACSAALIGHVLAVAENTAYTQVLNGRFKGGYTTRHYGSPALNLHAIQLEMAQSVYLEAEEQPFAPDRAKVENLSFLVNALLQAALGWRAA